MNPTTLLQHSAGAHAQWEPGAPAWAYALDDFGPWVLGAIFVVLLVRALMQQRRYRAVAVFDTAAQSAVHDALLMAESHTVGEIVPVVLERSDRHPSAEWLSALVTLLVGTALLQGLLPWHAPHLLILCQLGLGAFGFVLARALPAWKRLFISERRATEMALEQATQEFFRLGLHQTTARTGVLLFVSLLERRVVVLGDIGIHAKVEDGHWERTQTAVLEGVRRGKIEAGLIGGIRATGAQLAEHFPWVHGDRNEIPDRVVVRRE
jgi:putative membrane protein